MNSAPPRVLVADDDATVRLLMQAALEKHGFAITLVEDGEQALQEFAAAPFDLVLLDVDMPRHDGFEVCAEIRRIRGADIPIVLVTGHDDVASIERAYQTGATDFVAKPINWTLIGHRLRYVLRAFRTLQSLHVAEARNRAVLRALPDLLLWVNAESGRLIEQHGQPGVLGELFRPADLLSDRLPAEAAAQCRRAIDEAVATGDVQYVEFIAETREGPRNLEGRVAPLDEGGVLCLLRDTTERHEAEQRVHYLAYYDTLTGLPNRQAFTEMLEQAVLRVEQTGQRLAVLFVDLDGFKGINDSFGHNIGDLVLQWAAERLRTGLRVLDAAGRPVGEDAAGHERGEIEIARLGGDEFLVLVSPVAHAEAAQVMARRIGDMVRRPFVIEGQELVITASIGIGIFPDDARDATALLRVSDTAMYAAKAHGRDNSQYYSAALTERAVERLSMESRLRVALERQEFQLAYQPQVDALSGQIHSVEALIRWNHPEKGPIPPADFIPLAEENGQILPIGEWVLHTACTDAMRWLSLGLPAIRVAVNLSPIQFRNRNLLQDVLATLRKTGFPVDCLELEVTESALMEDADRTLEVLCSLRDAGLHITLDDFGTGYSSLEYLKRLPLSALKVDRSFVQDLPTCREDEAIVGAIITLAKNLGMRVTAEGVETQAQTDLLRRLGCDTFQGYYFSRPLPFQAMAALLAAGTLKGGEGSAEAAPVRPT